MSGMERFAVGVDAGGTHTRAASWGEDGEIRTAAGEGANWTVHGPELCRRRIGRVVDAALPSGSSPSTLMLTIAVYYPPDHAAAAREWAEDTWPGACVQIEPDVVGAWAGAFGGEPGIVLISGTGSIGYGRSRGGETARAGGWGPLLGDPGSAYAVGIACLQALAEYADGLTDAAALWEAVHERWPGMGEEPTRWVRGIYREAWGRKEIATLAEVVNWVAGSQDLAATRILQDAAAALARMAGAVRKRMGGEALPVALQGGLGSHSNLLRRALAAHLAAQPGSPALVGARYSPLQGALLLAAQVEGGDAALRRLREQLDSNAGPPNGVE